MTVSWSADYETGIAVIDFDHRSLFNITNLLCASLASGQRDPSIGETFDYLADHLDRMFSREEDIFIEAGYPGAAGHIEIHREIERTVRDIARKSKADPGSVSTREIVYFLETWLPRHIVKADSAYVSYVKARMLQHGEEKPRTRL